MAPRILIVGGTGRIGQAVARDLLRHTQAAVVVAGRDGSRGAAAATALGPRCDFVTLDLDQTSVPQLQRTVAGYDLVIQAAGPFRLRPPALLTACIAAGVNYVDLCDDRQATETRLALHDAAVAAGITALIDTGTFPGIDNVMVAAALADWPDADTVQLNFVCAGSGGGGFGVLETTFIAVSRPYEQLVDGTWQPTPSYRAAVNVDFGPPLGHCAVYNFEVPELWSLPRTFPQLRTCTAKFGTLPAFWNWATVALAVVAERRPIDHKFVGDAVTFALPVVHWVDRWVGAALGICIDIGGPSGLLERWTFFAPSTCDAVGWATGAAAAAVLDGTLAQPGVLLPETALSPHAYLQSLTTRGGVLRRHLA